MLHIENIQVEKMRSSDRDEVATLLTDAFETNPAYSLIFEGTGATREGLLWLFRTNLFLMNGKQTLIHVIREIDSGRIIGTFSVVPPGGVAVNWRSYFRIGLPGFIRKFGLGTLRTMMGMDTYNKEILNYSMQTKEYYYLSMVALREECWGKGIGSYALQTCLDELAKEKRTCSVMGLTTQLTENILFYSKLGFIKLDDGELSYQGKTYYNCNMKFVF